MSWVRVPPRAAPFSFEKDVVLVGVALFVMHLPYSCWSWLLLSHSICYVPDTVQAGFCNDSVSCVSVLVGLVLHRLTTLCLVEEWGT